MERMSRDECSISPLLLASFSQMRPKQADMAHILLYCVMISALVSGREWARNNDNQECALSEGWL
eukprot:4249280-Prymnesium_polylepis.1